MGADVISFVDHTIRDPLMHLHARDRGHDVRQALKVLNIDSALKPIGDVARL